MITFKLLIVIVAFDYAFSLPANNFAAQKDAKTVPLPSINLSSEITEPKLSRATRENKVEYIYLREGESPSLFPKHIYSTLKDEPAAAAPLPFKDDDKPKKPIDPKPNADNPGRSITGKDLHYVNGNSKIPLDIVDNIKLTNEPTLPAQSLISNPIVPVNPYNPLNTCVNSCLNSPYQTVPYQPYPYQQYSTSYLYQPYPISPLTNSLNAYTNPLNNLLAGNQLQLLLGGNQPLLTLLLKSYFSSLSSSRSDITTDIMPAILSYVLANKAIVPLIGSALSSLILQPSLNNFSPQINPLLSYFLPQQTPNLNYLLKGNIDGLTGYENLIYSGISLNSPNLINNALYPGNYQQIYPVIPSNPQMAPGSLYPLLPSYPILPGFARSSSPNPSSSSDTLTPNNDHNSAMTTAESHDSSSVDKRYLYTQGAPLRTVFDPVINYPYLNAYSSRFYRYPTYPYQTFPRYPAFPYSPAAAYYRSPLNLVPTVYPAYTNEIGFYSNFPEFARKNMDNHKSEGVSKDQSSLGKNPYNNLYSMKELKNDHSSLKEHHAYQDQPLDGNKIMMNERKKA